MRGAGLRAQVVDPLLRLRVRGAVLGARVFDALPDLRVRLAGLGTQIFDPLTSLGTQIFHPLTHLGTQAGTQIFEVAPELPVVAPQVADFALDVAKQPDHQRRQRDEAADHRPVHAGILRRSSPCGSAWRPIQSYRSPRRAYGADSQQERCRSSVRRDANRRRRAGPWCGAASVVRRPPRRAARAAVRRA